MKGIPHHLLPLPFASLTRTGFEPRVANGETWVLNNILDLEIFFQAKKAKIPGS